MRYGSPLWAVVLAVPGVFWCAGASGEETAAAAGKGPVVILRTATYERQELDLGSMWRYFETWQSDMTRVDGKLVNVDVFEGRRKADKTEDEGKGQWVICEPKQMVGSAFPPDGWRDPGFDDSDWIRHQGPFSAAYRSLALICLRGRFQAMDPAAAGDLTLTVKFQGGAVAYVNGQEVGRAFMPEGKIGNTTLAQDYPHEPYVTAKGVPLWEPDRRFTSVTAATGTVSKQWDWDDDMLNRFKQRGRTAEFKVPAGVLRKGVNLLAVEIHRAPADPVMFLTQSLDTKSSGSTLRSCWNRASVEDVVLSAAAPAAGLVPNISRPDGVQVWTEETVASMRHMRFGDPNEPLKPIRIRGLRNGAYSGRVVVSSRATIRNMLATVSDLKQGASTIPAGAIQIAYSDVESDALNATAPAEKAPPTGVGRRAFTASKEALDAVGVLQSVWVIVKIPKDAATGVYTGTLTVTVSGVKPMTVPVEVKVVGDWVLPDPGDFRTFVGLHESPDSLAMQYQVPLWSEEHWKLLDTTYRLLAQIGVKDVYLPVVAKTHLANEQSMVRWIKQPDGGYKHDFSIFERYLDTALKHLGKVPLICVYIHDYGFRIPDKASPASDTSGGFQQVKPCVTELDGATGKLSDLATPEWGTPDAEKFWKPVIDRAREILAKHGVEKSLMFGMAANNRVKPECLADLKRLYPDVLWVNRTHYFVPKANEGKVSQPFGLSSIVGGAAGIGYEPDLGESHCGWRNPHLTITFPRYGDDPGAAFKHYPSTYRIFGEGVLLTGNMGWSGVPGSHGIGHFGADFWPVMKDPRGGPPLTMANRYVFWHSLSIGVGVPSILAPGRDGPLATLRLQLMREALQEAEVRIFVHDALLDKATCARLGPELETRCRELCLERMWALRYYTQFAQPASVNSDYARVFSQRQWEDLSENLCAAAGDVARALTKK